ncbi:MAG: hypothetical protein HY898_10800 [Deltaproteobacteria bacterium]|nr:hypothetical protein [Deltaproteobacteria bacterium]
MNRPFLVPILLAGVWTCGGTVTTEPGAMSGGSGGADAGADSAAKGGTSTGGSATGGSSTGGSVATGGSAGAAGGPFVQCTESDPSPCKIFSDCCACIAYGPGEPPPPECLMDCFVDSCTSQGLPSGQKAACEVGRCVVGFDCDPAHVYCNGLPPDCEPGLAPAVVNGCWGGCVAAAECRNVPSCDACAKSELCVNHNYSNNEFHCVPVPSECAGNPTSSCLCPLVCPSWNFCNMAGPSKVQCDYI